jgi:3-mercaptopyruvate sulfurtransferase SseA
VVILDQHLPVFASRLGYENLMLYDGSMGEWANDASLPIETD